MADIARLGFSVDTSGLVRAERDLDKLGTAGKRTEKSLDGVGSASSSASGQLKGVSSSAGIAGVSFGKLGGAIAGAVAVFGSLSFLSDATSQMIEQSRQLTVLSNAYNVSTDSIQAWQSAAKPLGIEADKIGDIFKDVSDKIGDFATTGGGEAKDMFEQLGLSIKEFKSLAPDKAILKIGEALDKSKLTKSQKIFLLEGLADDASLLLPLLEDNAAALKKVSDNAAIRASFMSEADIRTMQAASGELKNIQLAARGIAMQAGLAGAAFLVAFGSDITSGIGAVSSGLSSISTEWAFFIDDLRYGDGIFAGLRESFDGFKMGLNGISEALFPAYDAVSRFVSTTDLLTPILPFIEEAVGSASLAFQTFARGVVFAVDTIEELGIVQMIGGWFSSASDALSPFSDTLSTIGLYIADFAGAFATAAGILGVGSAVFSVIAGGLGIVGSAFTALGAVMIANPVGLTIAAIAGAAYLIYNNWGAVSGFFTGLWSSVTASTTSAMQSISDAIANNQFMQEAGALFSEISATFAPVLSAFVDMHIAAWSAVGGAASEAMAALGGYISTGWDSAVAVFLQYEPALIEAASSIWSGIQSITSAAWQSLTALIGMAWDGIRGLLTAGLRLLRGDFEGAWAAIVETAHNLGDGLMQYFSGLPALMIDYGKNIVMGLADGMASAAGAAVESARAMAREVASSITGFFDMHSPSRLTHEYGYNIGSGLALGVDASTGLAVQSATAMAQSVGGSLGSLSTLGSGLESAGKSGQQFYVNQEKVNEALKDSDEKANSAKKQVDGLVDSLTKQRIELENGKLAAEYYTNRLNGLTDAAARAAAGAGQYNAYLSERKRQQQALANIDGGLKDGYLAKLEDLGLTQTGSVFDAIRVKTEAAIATNQRFETSLKSIGTTATAIGGTASQVVGILQQLGWTKNQAIGIAANLKQESEFRPSAVGDGGKAYGVAQWHPDRQANFASVMGKSIVGSSLEDQLKFLTYEMRRGNEIAAGRKLEAAATPQAAAAVVSRYYERPKDTEAEMQRRAEIATRIAAATGETASFTEKTTTALRGNTAASTDLLNVASAYSGQFDNARVTAGDITGLINTELQIATNGLLKTARDHTSEVTKTGYEYRQMQLAQMQLEPQMQAMVLAGESQAAYAEQYNALLRERAAIQDPSAIGDYKRGLSDKTLDKTQIESLTGLKLQNNFDGLLAATQRQRQEILLSTDAYRLYQLQIEDGLTPAMAAAIQEQEKYNEKLANFRQLGNDFAEILGNGVVGSLKDMVNTGNPILDQFGEKLIETMWKALDLQKSLNFSTSGSGGGLGSIFSGIGNWIGGLFGGGRANGGTVYSSKIHPINERGVPEVVTTSSGQYLMNTDGRVSPLTAVTPMTASGGGGGNISVVLNAPMTIDARGADDNSMVQLQGQIQAFQQRIYRDVPALVRQAQINARRSPSV